MGSPANAREYSAHVVEKRAPFSATTAGQGDGFQPSKTAASRHDERRPPTEVAGVISNKGVLGPSLQRIYDSEGPAESSSAGMEPSVQPHPPLTSCSEETLDLTESLLEAVFEISEFDPLPHFSFHDDEFGLGLPSDNQAFPAARQAASAKKCVKTPVTGRQIGPLDSPTGTSPAGSGAAGHSGGQSAAERRKLPRRESECIVSVCQCRGEERLTGERIAWLLHSTKLKGRLMDVSMSGVAFHLSESLPAETRILLRIANRTIAKQVDTTAVVLRSRAARDGGWDLVCRFEKNLTFEQIHTVGRSLFAATIV